MQSQIQIVLSSERWMWTVILLWMIRSLTMCVEKIEIKNQMK